MRKYYEENCLVEQKFVKNPDLTITQLIKGKLEIVSFERYLLGDGIEKEEVDTLHAMTGHISTDEGASRDEAEQAAFMQYQNSQLVPDAANAGEFWSEFTRQMKALWNGGSLPQE